MHLNNELLFFHSQRDYARLGKIQENLKEMMQYR